MLKTLTPEYRAAYLYCQQPAKTSLLMPFQYFDRPELYTGHLKEETSCDLCGEEKKCFDASSFYGTEELSAICPDCLATGKLYSKDVFTCTGDVAALRQQLKAYHPLLSDADIKQIARQKTEELEKTTPHLVTWQEWNWPCLEGDYGSFIGYGSRSLYEKLSGNGDGKELFAASLHESLKDDSDVEELWDVMPVGEIKSYEESNGYATLFYIFRSLKSDKIVTMWDCS